MSERSTADIITALERAAERDGCDRLIDDAYICRESDDGLSSWCYGCLVDEAAARLRALEDAIDGAVSCAERDCVVNPQYAGGLQPVIGILRAALSAPPVVPAPSEEEQR